MTKKLCFLDEILLIFSLTIFNPTIIIYLNIVYSMF